MKVLFPQILHFIKTGFAAPKKIIHLQMSQLYSIVRGKAGKSVEFGIKRGISRIDGFALGFVMDNIANIKKTKKLGVKHVGIAPLGQPSGACR